MNDTAQDIAVVEQPIGNTLAPLENPAAFVAGYVGVADELSRVIREKNLTTLISGKDHVRVEGWTLLGSMLGVFPVTVWTRPVMDGEAKVGWEARVEAKTRDGAVIGAAEAECLRSESLWKGRDDYALRSMAQTRATSKALRQPLGFVMTLAGFDATPAEEMPHNAGGEPKPTEKQIKYLELLLEKGGYDTTAIAGKPLSQLTRSEVSDFIEQLKNGNAPEQVEGEIVDEDDIPF